MNAPKIPDEAIAVAAAWWATVLEHPKFDALGDQRDSATEFMQLLMTVKAAKHPPGPRSA